MKVLISTQSTIEFDGRHYYGNSVGAMWRRYNGLGETTMICHLNNTQVASQDKLDESIKFAFIKKINSIKAILRRESRSNDLVAKEQVLSADMCIVHLPSDNGYQVIKYCRKYKKPYLTVVCGCSWDALWNHSIKGKLLALFGYLKLKNAQKYAPYSIYVTEQFLQKRYPSTGISIGCSNVNIHTGIEGVLEGRYDKIAVKETVLKIGTAAAVDVAYKGQEYVIKALGLLKQKGYDFEYHLIGKGLPRSLIEAMSRGCLCLGSRTAGIPELLEPEYVFSKGNVKEIASILSKVDENDLKKQAKRNYEKAKEYDVTILNCRRNDFLNRFKADNNIE